MEGREQIRLEALRVLTDLAVRNDQFRHGLWSDLEGTLTSYGFTLNNQEIRLIEEPYPGHRRQHKG